jgi:hypothetical protein
MADLNYSDQYELNQILKGSDNNEFDYFNPDQDAKAGRKQKKTNKTTIEILKPINKGVK